MRSDAGLADPTEAFEGIDVADELEGGAADEVAVAVDGDEEA